MNKLNGNRSGFKVMLGLIGMIKPLLGYMFGAITMGTLGHLVAIFITVLGGVTLGVVAGFFPSVSLTLIFTLILIFAVLRGILRYTEQASNHFIAFKLLASIRHQIFACLRKLAPAKLDGSEKGNLISIITSDIELLEVFYAHTISPIAIAFLTSVIMTVFMGSFHWIMGFIAMFFYLVVGVVIPIINSRSGQKIGRDYRSLYGKLNTVVLDNLYGLDEILQYHQMESRHEKMDAFTKQLETYNETLKKQEAWQRISTDNVILVAGVIQVIASGMLVSNGILNPGQALICVIALMSSFGPTAALSALSNNLNQTLASGNRVLDLLKEEPMVTDITERNSVSAGNITVNNVTFSYENGEKEVLKDYSITFKENTIHGILGKSGCGKSTLLKLLMRFYESEKGQLMYGRHTINEINTSSLREHIAYVTQETFLFQDTIANNIRIAKEDASLEEVMEAAKKASIHDFIESLPNKYETKLSELGDSVSGGERQRIGLARAFLHGARVILLDEPTSNIDSLNEAIILKSLHETKQDKTIILVSHRRSTMAIADEVTDMMEKETA